MQQSSDLLFVLRPVVEAFERLNIRYHIGGSVATNFYGVLRTTADVDLVANLDDSHIVPLLEALQEQYCVSESAMRDAVRRRSCFNLLHYEILFKVDVFVSKDREFDRLAQSRSVRREIGTENPFFVNVASPEDTILAKLVWYRLGNETSERQWSDLTQVAQVRFRSLDQQYVQHWATELAVADLWQRLHDEVAAKYRD
jgi:hypothetical protein